MTEFWESEFVRSISHATTFYVEPVFLSSWWLSLLNDFCTLTSQGFLSAKTFSGTPVISKITHLTSSHKWIRFCPTKKKKRQRAVCSRKIFPGSFKVLCFLLGLELSMLLFICISHLWVRQCPRGSDSLLDARAKNWAVPSCSIVFDGGFSAVLCLFLFGGYLLSWQSLIPAGDQGASQS